MSLKVFIQNLINNNIRNKTPKVIKVEHADVEDILLAEIYPSNIADSDIIQLYTSKQSTTRKYWFTIYKQGRTVFIYGWWRETNPFQTGPSKIFTLRDLVAGIPNEFLPDDTLIDTLTGLTQEFTIFAETPAGTRLNCSIANRAGAFNGKGFYVNESFLHNAVSTSRYIFNGSYPCKA